MHACPPTLVVDLPLRRALCAAVLVLCFAGTAMATAATQVVPSAESSQAPITKVVVFPHHAEITRQVEVHAVPGSNVAHFGALVPILNPHTLRASVLEPGARVTGTELRTVFLEESVTEELASLDARIQALGDEMARHGQAGARLREEQSFYAAVKERTSADMGRQLAAGAVSVDGWRDVLGFVSEGLAECDASLAALALDMRGAQQRLDVLMKERKTYAEQKPREMKDVSVSFLSEQGGPTRVLVHYIVDAAIWKPSYDVHLDRSSGELEIVGYGQIMQWTGEHWPDVELVLAMTRPDFELSVPDLLPLLVSLDDQGMAQLVKDVAFLGTSAQDQAAQWSAARFQRGQDRETFRRNLEQLSRRSDKQLESYGLSRRVLEGAMTRLTDRFATARYALSRRESIPCDSSPHKVVTFIARVPCKLQYVATPALGRLVMLQGSMVNTTGHVVLEGGAALFMDGSYVGSTQIPGAAQNESLGLNFGPDDALVVTRRLVSREVKGPEAFRQSQVITYRYEIVVENFNSRTVDVAVADQIPMSKTQDIQVEFVSASQDAGHDDQTGTLRWLLSIPGEGKSVLHYAFSVECPVGRDVHWS